MLLMVIRLLRDPEVLNKVLLQFAFKQAKAVGYVRLLAALLSAVMVSASLVIKIPQIRKILAPPTAAGRAALARGLSLGSVRLELLSQVVHVTYNQQRRTPFFNYGELLLLAVQNAVLLMVLEHYRRERQGEKSGDLVSDAVRLAKPAAALAAAVVLINKVAPPLLVAALQMVNIPIGLVAKVTQISRNETLQSTAHLLEVTVGANVVGLAIRVFTTLASRSQDRVLLAGYLASLLTNALLATQMVRFGNSQRKEL